MNVHLKNALLYGLPGAAIGYAAAFFVHRPNAEQRKILEAHKPAAPAPKPQPVSNPGS